MPFSTKAEFPDEIKHVHVIEIPPIEAKTPSRWDILNVVGWVITLGITLFHLGGFI